MRPLTPNEYNLISALANHFPYEERDALLQDLRRATVDNLSADGTIIGFRIDGYDRPPYIGQRLFPAEGTLNDADGRRIAVLLYADENGRLLELEFVREDGNCILGPNYETLEVH